MLIDSNIIIFASRPAQRDLRQSTASVLDKAVELRQRRKISLGDSLIAASAIVFGHSLATHNTIDFAWIPELQVLDPISNISKTP